MQNTLPPVFSDFSNYKMSLPDVSKVSTTSDKKAQNNKTEDSKTTVFALTALGAVAIGSLLAARKYKTSQQLAEYIDFTPAKTLKEAAEFAKKNLKIKEFNLTDLETANYINEALVNHNNNLSRDHKKIISSVKSMIHKDGIFGISCNGKELLANEEHIKNINETINESLQAAKQEGKINDIGIEGILKELPKYDLKDKFKIIDIIYEKRTEFLSNNYMYACCRADKTAAEFIKRHPELPQTTEDFVKLDTQIQNRILGIIDTGIGRIPRKENKQGSFGLINHEIGHVLHRKNTGRNLFEKYSDYGQLQADGSIDVGRLSRKFAEDVGEGLYFDIAGNVSLYATTTPAEFVAETYSCLCNGCKLPDNIMELYEKYGGVIPDNNNVVTKLQTIIDMFDYDRILKFFK